MGCGNSKKIAIEILETIEITQEVINKLIKNWHKYNEEDQTKIINKIAGFYSAGSNE